MAGVPALGVVLIDGFESRYDEPPTSVSPSINQSPNGRLRVTSTGQPNGKRITITNGRVTIHYIDELCVEDFDATSDSDYEGMNIDDVVIFRDDQMYRIEGCDEEYDEDNEPYTKYYFSYSL